MGNVDLLPGGGALNERRARAGRWGDVSGYRHLPSQAHRPVADPKQRATIMRSSSHSLMATRAKRIIGRSVNTPLGWIGLKVGGIKHDVVDLREQTDDPLEASYLAGKGAALINAPLRDCLVLHTSAFRCFPDLGNPFVEVLRRHGDGQSAARARAPLEAFFEAWQPSNAAEVLGIDSSCAHASLRTGHPLAYVLPWSSVPPQKALESRIAWILDDHKKAGLDFNLTEGWKGWGPCSDEVVKLEFDRLVRVFQSIRRRGFVRSTAPDGDIGAVALYADGESRYLVSPGHHRVAALAALGHTVAPVRLSSCVVRRNDVGKWPGVRSGLFSEKIALQVFDRIHAGLQPDAHVVRQKSDGAEIRDDVRPASRAE